MTTQRRDNHGSPFGLWLRNQIEPKRTPDLLDSKFGFITTDIDYIWENYKTNELMLLEEKKYNTLPTLPQINLFKRLDRYLTVDPLYKGYYVIVFENTTPDDGKIKIARICAGNEVVFFTDVSKEYFIKFLCFK